MLNNEERWSNEERCKSKQFVKMTRQPAVNLKPVLHKVKLTSSGQNAVGYVNVFNSGSRATENQTVLTPTSMTELIAAKLDYSCSLPPRKIKRIVSSLPARLSQGKTIKKSGETRTSQRENSTYSSNNLQDVLMSMLMKKGCMVKIHSYESVRNFFLDPTEQEIDAYKHDVINAVRRSDLEALRSFHQKGRPLKCSNRFGESLLHMACRSSLTEVVDFLVNEASVPVQVRDDFGRTPLHDAFWTPKPNFDLIDIIIKACPDLLYISDRRGQTALSYVRQDHRDKWKDYFSRKNVDFFMPKLFSTTEDNGKPHSLVG